MYICRHLSIAWVHGFETIRLWKVHIDRLLYGFGHIRIWKVHIYRLIHGFESTVLGIFDCGRYIFTDLSTVLRPRFWAYSTVEGSYLQTYPRFWVHDFGHNTLWKARMYRPIHGLGIFNCGRCICIYQLHRFGPSTTAMARETTARSDWCESHHFVIPKNHTGATSCWMFSCAKSSRWK